MCLYEELIFKRSLIFINLYQTCIVFMLHYLLINISQKGYNSKLTLFTIMLVFINMIFFKSCNLQTVELLKNQFFKNAVFLFRIPLHIF